MKYIYLKVLEIARKSSCIKNFLRFVMRKNILFTSCMVKLFIGLARITHGEFHLRNFIKAYYDDFYLRRDYSKYIQKILNEKIVHLDVGARGGSLTIAQKYSSCYASLKKRSS